MESMRGRSPSTRSILLARPKYAKPGNNPSEETVLVENTSPKAKRAHSLHLKSSSQPEGFRIATSRPSQMALLRTT